MNKENKNISLDPEMLSEAIKEQTKDTINSIIGLEVRKYLKESIEDDDDDKEKASAAEPEDGENVPAATEPALDNTDAGEAATDEPASTDEPATDEPVVDEPGEDDEWSNFDGYKVGDGEYDLTGEEDDAKLAKVWKALSDDDDVVVTQQGDGKIELKDKSTGAEYLIDPNAVGDEPASKGGEEGKDDEPIFEITMNEENLGYTDNYQSKNPVDGKEPYDTPTPNKTNNWDAGAPDSKNKPWAGPSKEKGEPYKGGVNEEENIFEITMDECGFSEENLEEGAISLSSQADAKTTKSQMHHEGGDEAQHKEVAKVASSHGELKEALNRIAKLEEENKVLKSSLVKFRKALNESVVTNANIGKFVKLVMENATSKDEKYNILLRFNKEAKTLEQSQALYESINKELKSSKRTNVSIDKPMAVNESAVKINENKIYESQDNTINESMDLMRRMGLLK